jgi:hypothetical protein
VVEKLGFRALRDRADLLDDLGPAQGRAREIRDGMSGVLRGMCKLPWLEAVAVTGRPAFGFAAPGEREVRLVVIAEGGRVRLARAAIAAYKKARGDEGARIRVETILDADGLAKPAGGRYDALRWSSLRPVMNPAGFEALRAANPWILVEFPNTGEDAGGGLPDHQVGSGRFDGRLARARRRLLGGSGEAADVVPLFKGAARISGGLSSLEEALQDRLSGDGAECPSREGAEAFEARFEARWEAVSAWEVEGDSTPRLSPTDVVIAPVETPKREKAAKTRSPSSTRKGAKKGTKKGTKKGAVRAEVAADPDPGPKPVASSRKRGAKKRPTRGASASTPETGRRARGDRRK